MKNRWSPDRPVRPERDPLLEEIVELLARDNRSRWTKTNVSGLSPTTLRNWECGRVRHPQAASIQLAARMLGCELRIVRRR